MCHNFFFRVFVLENYETIQLMRSRRTLWKPRQESRHPKNGIRIMQN